MKLDIIVFAAHPDDAELAMGGTIKNFTDSGLQVGIIDLTQGELGTRGTVETRKQEAEKASEILGIQFRDNLKLPDGHLDDNMDQVKAVVAPIRKYKPPIIFGPYFNDRHPDHIAAGMIIKKAMFYSGLPKIEVFEGNKCLQAFRPEKHFYFMQTYEFDPTFIVDISNTYEAKKESLKAYGTQFYSPDAEGPETFISKMNFTKYIEARARSYGFHIGKDFGEPFYSEEKLELDFVNYFHKLER